MDRGSQGLVPAQLLSHLAECRKRDPHPTPALTSSQLLLLQLGPPSLGALSWLMGLPQAGAPPPAQAPGCSAPATPFEDPDILALQYSLLVLLTL
jgi:hypothetical protein